MRVMALDVGDVRTGIAVSDPTKTIASPLGIFNAKKQNVIEEIERVVVEKNISTIVYGMPIKLNGSKGEQAVKVEKFILKLREYIPNSVNFISMDERFSSYSAKSAILQMGGKKRALDSLSATIILQTYLDKLRISS